MTWQRLHSAAHNSISKNQGRCRSRMHAIGGQDAQSLGLVVASTMEAPKLPPTRASLIDSTSRVTRAQGRRADYKTYQLHAILGLLCPYFLNESHTTEYPRRRGVDSLSCLHFVYRFGAIVRKTSTRSIRTKKTRIRGKRRGQMAPSSSVVVANGEIRTWWTLSKLSYT